MSRLWQPKRVLVCMFVALTSGIVSAYVGSQISLKVQTQKCQAQPWVLETVCQAWVTPRAVWQGSTTGLYLGTLLGGIASILGTTKINPKKVNIKDELAENLGLFANELELTPTQRAVLQRFLILLMLKLAASSQKDSEAEVATLSVEELQQLLAIAKRKQLLEHHLTSEQIAQSLEEISICQTSQIISHLRTTTHISSQAKDN